MKVNLSIDEKAYKDKVATLRQKLNKCKKTGVLDDEFEKELQDLLLIEEKLLTELIPYYRLYIRGAYETRVNLSKVKEKQCTPSKESKNNFNIFLSNNAMVEKQLPKEIAIRKDKLKGKLCGFDSKGGTGIILTEDGLVYLIEENFGRWTLKAEPIIKDIFFIKVLALSSLKYLLTDIEDKTYYLDLYRVHTPNDLWDRSLYQ